MVRSLVVVVSDDQSLNQKAQQFAQANGVTCQVMTPEQWEATLSKTTEVPSLVSGHNSFETAKVLQFPGTAGLNSGGGQSGDTRRGVATINQLEATAIENAIAAFKGNLTEAAKALGIGRATLYRKVKQYNIDPSVARNKKKAA
jgi:transcriptional regulator of acetoin/glycerol metabolism